MLQAFGISHEFDYPLLNNIDFSINANSSKAILGVSGSGKSTFLHILSSFLSPKSGVVKFMDKDIYKLSSKELTQIRKKYIGLIFQQHYLFRGFSAYENLQISSIVSGQKEDLELLEKLKISHLMQQNISELSGGQQQRVSIARILFKKPKIIFADEPTGNLDKKTANDVMSVLLDYIQTNSAALLLVTHDDEVANMCDKKYFLKNGKLLG